jgi:repressor of nif and glnA expression
MSPTTQANLTELIHNGVIADGLLRELRFSDVLHLRHPGVDVSAPPPVSKPSRPPGCVAARVENLACQTTLDVERRQGNVILNLSTIPVVKLRKAKEIVRAVIGAGLGMGRYIKIERDRPRRLTSSVTLGTVSSVSFDGLLRSRGIPITAKFGGLVEIENRIPTRFTQIIHYDATTIDPIEIFIKGKMTSVHRAAETGNGIIGAGFREISAAALSEVKAIIRTLERIGIGAVLLLGEPGRPVLDIPVSPGRVGAVITAGLNPVAAVEENDIPTHSFAMSLPVDFSLLQSAI